MRNRTTLNQYQRKSVSYFHVQNPPGPIRQITGVNGRTYQNLETEVVRAYRPQVSIEADGLSETDIRVTNGNGEPLSGQVVQIEGAENSTVRLDSNGEATVTRLGQALTVNVPGASPSDIASEHATLDEPRDMDFDGQEEDRYELFSERSQFFLEEQDRAGRCVESGGAITSGRRICNGEYIGNQAQPDASATVGGGLQLQASHSKTFYLRNPLMVRLVMSMLSTGIAISPLIVLWVWVRRAAREEEAGP